MKNINGTFKNINRGNWSGEVVDVVVKNGEFEMFDYKFSFGEGQEEFWDSGRSMGGWVKLEGDDWSESLTTLHLLDDFDDESIVRAAVVWISNHI